MEIGLIYSRKDPRQTVVRDFVREYIRERGILASVVEQEDTVESPQVTIDGYTLKDRRRNPRGNDPKMFPAIADIARALEQSVWSI